MQHAVEGCAWHGWWCRPCAYCVCEEFVTWYATFSFSEDLLRLHSELTQEQSVRSVPMTAVMLPSSEKISKRSSLMAESDTFKMRKILELGGKEQLT